MKNKTKKCIGEGNAEMLHNYVNGALRIENRPAYGLYCTNCGDFREKPYKGIENLNRLEQL